MSGRRRDLLVDLTCVLLALAYTPFVLWIGDATRPGAALPWPVDAAIGVLGAASLWWRRRWPLGLALALAPFGAVSAGVTGALTVAVFTVAVHRPARVALAVGALNVATVTVYFGLHDDPAFPVWVDLGTRSVVQAGAIGWGMFVRAHRGLVDSLRERNARLEAEQQLRVDQARLTERARIAREMHDVLAHRMSLVSLHAGALEVSADARPDKVASAAAVIRANAHAALQELRAVIGVLREGVPDIAERPLPGLPDVPELVESSRAAGLEVAYTCALGGATPAPLLGRTAYRIVQEGLTNARKHAPGAAVEVRVDGGRGDGLRVRVTNALTDSSGAVPGAGVGLVGLRERVVLAGGRFVHGRDPAGGFRIEAWLPWTS